MSKESLSASPIAAPKDPSDQIREDSRTALRDLNRSVLRDNFLSRMDARYQSLMGAIPDMGDGARARLGLKSKYAAFSGIVRTCRDDRELLTKVAVLEKEFSKLETELIAAKKKAVEIKGNMLLGRYGEAIEREVDLTDRELGSLRAELAAAALEPSSHSEPSEAMGAAPQSAVSAPSAAPALPETPSAAPALTSDFVKGWLADAKVPGPMADMLVSFCEKIGIFDPNGFLGKLVAGLMKVPETGAINPAPSPAGTENTEKPTADQPVAAQPVETPAAPVVAKGRLEDLADGVQRYVNGRTEIRCEKGQVASFTVGGIPYALNVNWLPNGLLLKDAKIVPGQDGQPDILRFGERQQTVDLSAFAQQTSAKDPQDNYDLVPSFAMGCALRLGRQKASEPTAKAA